MNNLDKMALRSRQYWFDDGLVELLVGGLFATLGGLFWWQMATGAGGWVTAVAMPLVILAGALGLGWLLRMLKEQFIYPRTGFVAYSKPQPRQRWRSGLLGLLFGALCATMISLFSLDAWIPALMGAGVGLFLFVLGFRLALLRFQLLAIWSIGAGVVLAFLETAEPAASALILLLIAGGLMLSGVINLLRYLANSEPPNDQPAEVG